LFWPCTPATKRHLSNATSQTEAPIETVAKEGTADLEDTNAHPQGADLQPFQWKSDLKTNMAFLSFFFRVESIFLATHYHLNLNHLNHLRHQVGIITCTAQSSHAFPVTHFFLGLFFFGGVMSTREHPQQHVLS